MSTILRTDAPQTAPRRRETSPAPGSIAPRPTTRRPRLVPADEGYVLWAPTYDGDPNPLLALEERIVEALLPSIAGKDALDLACGTGRWLEKLRKSGARSAVGIDLSPAMLAVAKTKHGLRQRLVRADCLALPLRSGAIDLAICSFALGHVADLNRFARELAGVMRPGADCYLSDLHPAARAKGWRTGFRFRGGAAEIPSFAHSCEELRQAFESQGLKLTRSFEPCLGEAERPVFAQARRSALFPDAARIAAILICQFTRLAAAPEAG